MTIVTTSLLLAGSSGLQLSLSAASGQTAPQPEEAWKTDPAVHKAADQIYSEFLVGTTWSDAKTQGEIAKRFAKLSPDMIDKALKRLRAYDRAIVRLGDGDQASPYRYCECQEHHG